MMDKAELGRRVKLERLAKSMTLKQVADAMVELLAPRGVIVVVDCEHLCMSMRGVRKPGSRTVTSAVRGQLLESTSRAEAMSLILGR